jgi:hypothetical protein
MKSLLFLLFFGIIGCQPLEDDQDASGLKQEDVANARSLQDLIQLIVDDVISESELALTDTLTSFDRQVITELQPVSGEVKTSKALEAMLLEWEGDEDTVVQDLARSIRLTYITSTDGGVMSLVPNPLEDTTNLFDTKEQRLRNGLSFANIIGRASLLIERTARRVQDGGEEHLSPQFVSFLIGIYVKTAAELYGFLGNTAIPRESSSGPDWHRLMNPAPLFALYQPQNGSDEVFLEKAAQ